MINILYICLGNICRSPVAEGTMKELVKQKGLTDKIYVDSAGTMGWHTGQLPDPRAIKNAEKHGIKLTHLGRKITDADLDSFQHIIVMDEQNFEDVYEYYYKTKHKVPAADKLFLIRDYDPTVKGKQEVPDPYYESAEAFENVFQIVWRSNEALLEHLIEKYGLLNE